jgi:hypothetical protein
MNDTMEVAQVMSLKQKGHIKVGVFDSNAQKIAIFNDRLKSIEVKSDLKNLTKDEQIGVRELVVQPNTFLMVSKSKVDLYKLQTNNVGLNN